MSRKTRTLRYRLFMAVCQTVVLSSVALMLLMLCGPAQPVGGTHGHTMDTRPNAVGSADYLVEKFDCWTGDAPDDVDVYGPGHAVVTREDRNGVNHTYYTLSGEGWKIYNGHRSGVLNAFCY